MSVKIGYVGLGTMGGHVAGHIVRKGHDLTVFDLLPEKVAALAQQGAKTGASVAAVAATCDVLFICVENPGAVETVLFGPQGVLAARPLPRLVVDNSTVPPQTTRALAERLRVAGVAFLDAPFSGGVNGAKLGTLATMVGGAPEDFERVRAVLETFSSRVSHMGPVGSGQATKLCNQIIDFATVAAIGEAVAFGRAFGVDVARLPAAVEGGLADSAIMREYAREQREGAGPSTWLIEGVAELLRGGAVAEGARALQYSLKDLDMIVEAAREIRVAVPVSALTGGLFRMWEARQG